MEFVTKRRNSMTGQELLEFLLTLKKEDLVKELCTEGCDCYGAVKTVEVDYKGINLNRT